jgi:hypothetical protein
VKRVIGMGLVLGTLLALSAGLASAGTATPRVNRRESRQHARIRQGVESGQLTPLEAARLREMQWHLRRMELIAKADGVVTPTERLMLLRAQNRQSRYIYRLEHNARTKI